MSSFIVSDDTINKVVSYFYLQQMGSCDCSGAYHLRCRDYNVTTEEGQQQLADEMAQLNMKAFVGRYPQEQGGEISDIRHPYRFTTQTNRMQALKALQCWHYQCAQDAAVDDDLYKLMEEIKGLIAQDIVRDLPEYQAAPWG